MEAHFLKNVVQGMELVVGSGDREFVVEVPYPVHLQELPLGVVIGGEVVSLSGRSGPILSSHQGAGHLVSEEVEGGDQKGEDRVSPGKEALWGCLSGKVPIELG